MKRFFLLAILINVICNSSCVRSTDSTPLSKFYFQDSKWLGHVRQQIKAGDASVLPSYKKLLADADAAMKQGPFSVTHKESLAPSGDKHDYVSRATYWWPDPKSPNGLPYVRRDGERNPEIDKFDRVPLETMGQTVETLALAYYLSGQKKYSHRAARLLRTWFLDPETRMNPHLKYAQGIPGINEGRGIGIIDTMFLVPLPDAIAMLEGAPGWSNADTTAMKEWFRQYLHWLRHSSHGQQEEQEHNNHGTWYDVQVATYGVFTGQPDIAQKVLSRVAKRRITPHIMPDGKQPAELARTRSLSYSVLNLKGLMWLALLGERLDTNLWNFETADGRSIRKAVEFLAPYADETRTWPDPQIVDFDRDNLRLLVHIAANKYNNAAFRALVDGKAGGTAKNQRFRLSFSNMATQ